MNFRRGRSHRDEPEINLIPMIDVLLVIIIFLMLTTTYAKFSGLEINLPTADASKQPSSQRSQRGGDPSGQVLVNKAPLTRPRAGDQRGLAPCRRRRQGPGDRHQRRRQGHAPERGRRHAGGAGAGYPHISFATQSPR
jgi:biopolymer transport protein ExbD